MYVDGVFAGSTPTDISVSRDKFRDHIPVRFELEGYVPYETELRKIVRTGRIVASVFTLGIPLMIGGPYGFAKIQPIVMVPNTTTASRLDPPRDGALNDRLRRLDEMRSSGLISAEEHRKLREKALQREIDK